MLRTLLAGILAVSAAASCSKKSDAPAAIPGATAGKVGKVVEVTGSVTATRGADVRPLAAGGEISSDDVIDTAANSRVVILVAHNNARWDLGPNKHGKVGDSLAWTAAKQDRPATAVTEETSTAGRYADKNAATTDTTTASKSASPADSEPDMMPKGGEAVAADQAPTMQPHAGARPSDGVAPSTGGRRNAAVAAAAPSKPMPPTKTTAPPPPPPPPPPPDSERLDRAPRETAVVQEAEKNVPPKTESSKTESSRQKTADVGRLDVKKPPSPGSSGDSVSNPVPPKPVVSGPEHALELEIRDTLVKQRVAIAACLGTTERLEVSITVTKGVYSITTKDQAATDTMRACFGKVAKKLTATKQDKALTVLVTLKK